MDECEKFLKRQPTWIRALLTDQYDSPELRARMARPGGFDIPAYCRALDEYEELLRRCPRHLREYRKQQAKRAKENALAFLPSVKLGRPPEDSLAQEAKELEGARLSQSKIARELNRRHPNRRDSKGNPSPLTAEAVRKMLARRRRPTPDKT